MPACLRSVSNAAQNHKSTALARSVGRTLRKHISCRSKPWTCGSVCNSTITPALVLCCQVSHPMYSLSVCSELAMNVSQLRRRCGSCCGCVADGELPQVGAVCDDEAVLVGEVQQADKAQVHAQVRQLAGATVVVQLRNDVLHAEPTRQSELLQATHTYYVQPVQGQMCLGSRGFKQPKCVMQNKPSPTQLQSHPDAAPGSAASHVRAAGPPPPAPVFVSCPAS